MSQNFLQRFQVDTICQHQRCRRVAELMRGKLRRIQPGFQQVLLDQPMDRGDADAVFVPGAEQCLVVREDDVVPLFQIPVDGPAAGRTHVDDPFLVALADNADAVFVDVGQIQPDQLRAPDPAVEKQHQDGKIPVFIRAIDRPQQRGRFFQRQVFRQAAADLGEFDVLDRVIWDLLGADGQILIECLDCRKLARAGSGRDPGIVRTFAVLTVVRQVGQEIKDLRRRDGIQNRRVDPFDIDGIQRRIVRQLPAHQRQEAKEHPQIQMIFLDGTSGLALDRLMIR